MCRSNWGVIVITRLSTTQFGKFKIEFPSHVLRGLWRLRIGQKEARSKILKGFCVGHRRIAILDRSCYWQVDNWLTWLIPMCIWQFRYRRKVWRQRWSISTLSICTLILKIIRNIIERRKPLKRNLCERAFTFITNPSRIDPTVYHESWRLIVQ